MTEKEKQPRPDQEQQDRNGEKEEPHRPDVKKPEGAGTLAFAVLAGGPRERFAVPWRALKPDAERDCYVLDYAAAR